MVGTPVFGASAAGQTSAGIGDSFGVTLYVNTEKSGSGNGYSQKNAFLTMAEAFAELSRLQVLQADGPMPGGGSNSTIYVEGDIREQLETPADVYGVKIVGLYGGGPRHTTASGVVLAGNGAAWREPASPVADQPLLRLQEPGWEVHNLLFIPGAGIAGIEIYSADPLEGGHAIIRGCRFNAADTTSTIGIEDVGGSGFIRVENCFFQTLASGIVNTSTSQSNPSWWVVTGNRFLDNTEHIDMPAVKGYFTNNIFDEATVNIDFTGGNGNTVNFNSFANAQANIKIADGYIAGTSDVWEQNYATDAADYGVPD